MRRADVNPDVLRSTEIFAALGDADRLALAACLQGRRFARGEVVLREGEPGEKLLVIAEGRLVATARAGHDTTTALNEMGPGEVMGEMSFLDPAPVSATVTAATDGVAYELSRDAMGVLRERAPAAVAAIVKAALRDVTHRLRRLDERIERELDRIGGER